MSEENRPAQPRRILIVDDEPTILLTVRRFLLRHGMVVSAARELEEAKALLLCGSFDVLIVDLRLSRLGGIEGLELLSFVQSLSPRTAVVILTAYGSPEIEQEALQRGAARMLQKPIALQELHRIVEEVAPPPVTVVERGGE